MRNAKSVLYMERSRVKRGVLYTIADSVMSVEKMPEGHDLAARWTGEKRAPKKGEWYLSGSTVLAWQAPNDLSDSFHIAEIVVTHRRHVLKGVETKWEYCVVDTLKKMGGEQ